MLEVYKLHPNLMNQIIQWGRFSFNRYVVVKAIFGKKSTEQIKVRRKHFPYNSKH